MIRRLIPALPLLLTAGCIPPADHPSLAPRPIEQRIARPPVDSVVPLRGDAALEARLVEALGEAGAASVRFDAALGEARTAVAAAAGAVPGSEAWVAAEQALSRAEAARGPVALRLADLDSLRLEVGEIASLEQARAELSRLDAGQRAALSVLEAVLSRP